MLIIVINSQSHVAAVVIMACNRPDYLERTIQSILKYVCLHCFFISMIYMYLNFSINFDLFAFVSRYHSPFASKFVLFISQVLDWINYL